MILYSWFSSHQKKGDATLFSRPLFSRHELFIRLAVVDTSPDDTGRFGPQFHHALIVCLQNIAIVDYGVLSPYDPVNWCYTQNHYPQFVEIFPYKPNSLKILFPFRIWRSILEKLLIGLKTPIAPSSSPVEDAALRLCRGSMNMKETRKNGGSWRQSLRAWWILKKEMSRSWMK